MSYRDIHDAEFNGLSKVYKRLAKQLFTIHLSRYRTANICVKKPQQFIEQHLRVDEDKNYVLQSVSMCFLGS
jgi:hypothetical protein